MFRRREDRLFEEFRKTRDPRALAAVFDRTAPELGRVALHLTRDRSDAEDAVQQCYLTAIEDADSWDAKRPLTPWLLGILVHAVQAQRRRRSRRLDEDRLRRESVREPVEEIEAAELEEAFDRALEQVPEAYRATVHARLVEQRTAADIAREEGVPASTVRMRLMRGLDHLRKRLPRSHALPTLVGATGLSLTKVKAQILSRLGDPRPAPVPVSTTTVAGTTLLAGLGGLTMVKVLSVVLALAAALLLFANPFSTSPDVTTDLEREAETKTVVELGESKTVPERDDTTERRGERAVATPPTPFRIRLLDPFLDRGVEYAKLRVTGERTMEIQTIWGGIARATTRAKKLTVEVLPPFRVAEDRYEFDVVPNAENLFTIRLEATLEVEVLVLDESDRPVVGASVVGWKKPYHNWGWGPIGTTDAHGKFRARTIEPHLTLTARADGWAVPKYRTLRASTGAKQRTTIRLTRAGARVAGRVLDFEGKPVANAMVAIQRCVTNARRMHLSTDSEGRFETRSVTPGANYVVTMFEREASERGKPHMRVDIDRGSHWTRLDVGPAGLANVELRETRGAAVHGRVRSERIKDATLRAIAHVPQMDSVLLNAISRRARISKDGSYRMTGLQKGDYRLRVKLGDSQIEKSVALTEGETHRWDPGIDSKSLTIRVLDEKQQPMRGAELRLRKSQGWRLQKQKTDEEGRARFADLADAQYELRIFFDGSPFFSHGENLDWQAEELTVVVPKSKLPTVTLRGSVALAGEGERDGDFGAVIHCHTAPELRRLRSDESQVRLELAADGSFELKPVPPGKYSVMRVVRGRPMGFTKQRDAKPHETLDFGHVAAIALARVQLVVPASSRSGLEIHLRLADGTPGRTQRFHGMRPKENDDGFLLEGLPPKTVDMLVCGPRFQPYRTTLQLRAGITERVTMPILPATRCAFSLVASPKKIDNRVFGRLTILAENGETLLAGRLPTAKDDHLTRGLPPGRYRARVRLGTHEHEEAITVPRTAGIHEIRLEVK